MKYSYFECDLETYKVKVMSEVKGEAHILYPMYIRCTSFSYQSDHPFQRYGQNSIWPWKNASKIFKENLTKKNFHKNFSKI